MGKQSSVGNLPAGQVAPGLPILPQGISRGTAPKRLTESFSFSVSRAAHPRGGCPQGSSWPRGIYRSSRFLSGSFWKEAPPPSAPCLLWLKVYALWGEGVTVGEGKCTNYPPGALSNRATSVGLSILSCKMGVAPPQGGYEHLGLGPTSLGGLRDPRPSALPRTWGWSNAQGSERTSLLQLKLPFKAALGKHLGLPGPRVGLCAIQAVRRGHRKRL